MDRCSWASWSRGELLIFVVKYSHEHCYPNKSHRTNQCVLLTVELLFHVMNLSTEAERALCARGVNGMAENLGSGAGDPIAGCPIFCLGLRTGREMVELDVLTSPGEYPNSC